MIADDRLAYDLATEAGQRLLELRSRSGFGAAAELRAAGDRLSHEYITAELASHRPGDAVLSEEGSDDPARLRASRVWIVDPLDGTREFGEAGRTDWGVHVALWRQAETDTAAGGAPARAAPEAAGWLAAGAVALPAQGQAFATLYGGGSDRAADHGGGAGPPPDQDPGPSGRARSESRPGGRLRLIVSRTRPPDFVRRLAVDLGADLVALGSAGAKIISVLTGAADAYVHAGGQYEWDSAAPVAVAQAAGLHASRIDGSPLTYNQPDPRLPDILVCRPEVAGMLLAAISAARGVRPERPSG